MNNQFDQKNQEKINSVGASKKPRISADDLFGYVFVPFFVIICFGIALYHNGIYPFGKATMSSYDMLAQVAPFIEHFYDVMSGKSSLFYSYAIAGGADVYGTLSYCCVSPFTFIFLLFGKGNVYYGTSIVLPLKIACVGLSALIYLKKRFKNIPTELWVALALSYAFCGYLFVSNTYINWVDLMIYLPFVALGFKRIVDGGKKTTFIVALALMIYTCFSISCFSLLIIFPIMIAYCIFVVEKQNRAKIITDVVIALCLTIAVCLPILVPSLMAFLGSGRKTGLFDNLFNDITADPLYYKASYLFTDGLTLLFTVIYFIKNGVKRPIDRFLMLACVLTLLPVFIDEACNLLNFGSYMSYALRFGFLNGFYFLFVASLYFDNLYERVKQRELLSNENLCSNEQLSGQIDTPLNGQTVISHSNKKEKVRSIILTSVLFVLCAVGAVGIYILDIYVKDGTYTQSFSARFAHSLGGLEVTAVIFAIVAIIALYGVLLANCNKISHKIVVPVLLLVVCGQSMFYTTHLVRGNKYTPTRYDQIEVLTDYVNELEGNGDTRVKMNGDYLTAVMPFTLGTNAFTVFSSVIDARNFVPTSFFGFGGNGVNTMKSYNGTTLGDCLLGYKYFITSKDDEYKISSRSYLEKVDLSELVDENGNALDYGEYLLYKNNYAFPSALTVYSVPYAHESDRFSELNDLMLALTGDTGVVVKTIDEEAIILLENKVINDESEEDVDEDRVTYRVRNYLNGYGQYYFAFDFEDYDQIYYNIGQSYVPSSQKPLPDNGVINLGYGSGGSYSVCLTRPNGEPLTAEYIAEHVKTIAIMNADVKKVSQRVNEENAKVTLSAGKIKVEITAQKDKYLMLNYVALPGHTVTVNGREAELEQNSLNLMVVKLDEGENSVEISYSSPYIKLMALGVLLALFIFAVYYIAFVKFKLLNQKMQLAVSVLAYTLAVAVVLFFMVMPTGVFAFKGVKALINLIF